MRNEMSFVGSGGGTASEKVSKSGVESPVPPKTPQEIPSYFAKTAEGDANLEKAGFVRTRAGLLDQRQVETAPKSYTEEQNEARTVPQEVSENTGEPLVMDEAEAQRRLDFLKQEMSEVRAGIITADLKGDAVEKGHLMEQLAILLRSQKRIEDSQKTV